VEDFKYFGTALTNQNSVQEEIKNILKPGNASYLRCRMLFFFQFAVQKFKD